jgi:cobalt-zinc-cadmium efflux system outer membrane protein
MLLRLPLYVLLLVIGPGVAAAQQVLTEAEAVARLSLESPRGRAARAEVDLVKAEAMAAGRFPNPSFTVSREAVAGTSEGYFLVSQSLPIWGRRGLQSDGAAERVRAAEFRAEDLQRLLRAAVRRAFVDLSTLESRERELQSAVAALQSLADVLGKREAAGDAAGFDRMRAEREALDVAATLGDTRARRIGAQAALAALFFPLPDPALLHAAPLAEQPPLPGADELLARAKTGRTDLLALGREIEAARLEGSAAARGRVPEPEVVAGVKTSSLGDDRQGSVLSLNFAVPLFDRAQPERAKADAKVRLATAERDARLADISATVVGLRDAAQELRTTADTYRRLSVPKSDQLRRIAQVSYDAGERGILELLDAFQLASAARLRLIELEAASAMADIDLEWQTTVEIRK